MPPAMLSALVADNRYGVDLRWSRYGAAFVRFLKERESGTPLRLIETTLGG